MSETGNAYHHNNLSDPAAILAQRGLNVPESWQSATVEAPTVQPGQYASSTFPEASQSADGTNNPVVETQPYIDPIFEGYDASAYSPADRPQSLSDILNEETQSLPTIDADTVEVETIVPDPADEPAANGPRSHRKKFDKSKLNPMTHVRGAAGYLRAREIEAGTENRNRKLRTGLMAGAIAVTTTVAAVALAKHGIHQGVTANANWHPGDTGSGNLNEHVTTMHDPSVTGHHTGGAETITPDTSSAQADHTHHEATRTALADDPRSHRASNVTDWSRQTIHDEAVHSGLSEQQADTLAHNQHNIDSVNNAFYHDNPSVGSRHGHMLNADHTYKVGGTQTTTADHIVDKFKVEHHIHTSAPEAHTAGTDTSATGTHAGNGAETGAPTPEPTPHTNPVPHTPHTPEAESVWHSPVFDTAAGLVTAGGAVLAGGGAVAYLESRRANQGPHASQEDHGALEGWLQANGRREAEYAHEVDDDEEEENDAPARSTAKSNHRRSRVGKFPNVGRSLRGLVKAGAAEALKTGTYETLATRQKPTKESLKRALKAGAITGLKSIKPAEGDIAKIGRKASKAIGSLAKKRG